MSIRCKKVLFLEMQEILVIGNCRDRQEPKLCFLGFFRHKCAAITITKVGYNGWKDYQDHLSTRLKPNLPPLQKSGTTAGTPFLRSHFPRVHERYAHSSCTSWSPVARRGRDLPPANCCHVQTVSTLCKAFGICVGLLEPEGGTSRPNSCHDDEASTSSSWMEDTQNILQRSADHRGKGFSLLTGQNNWSSIYFPQRL